MSHKSSTPTCTRPAPQTLSELLHRGARGALPRPRRPGCPETPKPPSARSPRGGALTPCLRSRRVHQGTKNALVLVPAAAALVHCLYVTGEDVLRLFGRQDLVFAAAVWMAS